MDFVCKGINCGLTKLFTFGAVEVRDKDKPKKQIGEDWVNLEGVPAEYLKEDISFYEHKVQKMVVKNENSNKNKEVDKRTNNTDEGMQITLWQPKGKKYGVVTTLQKDKNGGYIAGNQSQPIWFSNYNCFGDPQAGSCVTYWATQGQGEKPQAVQVEIQTEHNLRCNKIREQQQREVQQRDPRTARNA